MRPRKLDCLTCPSFCCFMGFVEVSTKEVKRLAKFLGITEEQFERRHLRGHSPAGEMLIKEGLQVCQFLGEDRKCTVYEARPQVCRSYHCWEQKDEGLVVYRLAAFVQKPLGRMKKPVKIGAQGGSRFAPQGPASTSKSSDP